MINSAANPANPEFQNVYQLETKRESVTKNRQFAPVLMTFLLSKVFTSTEALALSLFAKDSGYRHSVYTLADLGDLLNKSADTMKKMIRHLVDMGMIEVKRAPKNRGLIITRTALWDEESPIRLRDKIKAFAISKCKQKESKNKTKSEISPQPPQPPQADLRQEKDDQGPGEKSPPLKLHHYIKEKRKRTKPAPQPPQQPPPQDARQKSRQSSIDFFTKKQVKAMSLHAEPIMESCQAILQLPARPGVGFNPMQAVGRSLKTGKHPAAIAETLAGMVKSWDAIQQPWKIYEYQLKIKNQNFNAAEAERQAQRHKSGLKDFLRELAGGFIRVPSMV